QFLDERDPSPVWGPLYNDGAIVRMANGPGEIDPGDSSWAAPRVLYYHHPSDPVGYWNWETLWRPQEWTDKPVGGDVPDSVRWIPFTTFTQVVVDLINGFSASVGHGHNYNDVFVEGWSIVAPREGWTASDTSRLQNYLISVDLPGL
ncbi:MAG: alpha/beta-hydrolase family protein, partial [Acidimicrobiia bacterium]